MARKNWKCLRKKKKKKEFVADDRGENKKWLFWGWVARVLNWAKVVIEKARRIENGKKALWMANKGCNVMPFNREAVGLCH